LLHDSERRWPFHLIDESRKLNLATGACLNHGRVLIHAPFEVPVRHFSRLVPAGFLLFAVQVNALWRQRTGGRPLLISTLIHLSVYSWACFSPSSCPTSPRDSVTCCYYGRR